MDNHIMLDSCSHGSFLKKELDLETKEEKYVIVLCRAGAGKEIHLLEALTHFVKKRRGLSGECRVMLSRGTLVLAMPLTEYMHSRDILVESLRRNRDIEFMELFLPRADFLILELGNIVSAFRDIEFIAGPVLTSTILFRLGLVYGRELAKNVDVPGAVTPGEKVRAILELLKALHLYRHYEIVSMSVDNIEIAFEVVNDMGYCHFVRGVVTGVVSSVLARNYICNVKKVVGNIVLIELTRE